MAMSSWGQRIKRDVKSVLRKQNGNEKAVTNDDSHFDPARDFVRHVVVRE